MVIKALDTPAEGTSGSVEAFVSVATKRVAVNAVVLLLVSLGWDLLVASISLLAGYLLVTVAVDRDILVRIHVRVRHLGSLSLELRVQLLVLLVGLEIKLVLVELRSWVVSALPSVSMSELDVIRVSEHVYRLAALGYTVKAYLHWMISDRSISSSRSLRIVITC